MKQRLVSLFILLAIQCVAGSAVAGDVALSLRYINDPSDANLRTQYFRGEVIMVQIDSAETGGFMSIEAIIDDQATEVWKSQNDRTMHSVRVDTGNLRTGQYEFVAVRTAANGSERSFPLKIGITPPIEDAFPIYTFTADKRNVPRADEAYTALIRRFRKGGYNQVYTFQRSGAFSAGGRENPHVISLMNECAREGMGVVMMLNSFLYGSLDDDTAVVTASGNFATTYVYEGSLKRMTSVRHPRHIEGVKDYLRIYLTFAKKWPVIRGLALDDEPTASFYNVFGAGRVDKAPEGERFWGLGDYNAANVTLFKQRYGATPPNYAQANEVFEKYPPGSIVSDDDWFQWMDFTGRTFGDYYAEITPTIREITPQLKVFSQPFLGLCGAFWGIELQSFHGPLDRVNFHYLGSGQPVENAASVVILGHAVKGNKPIQAMIHSAVFEGKTPADQVYAPAYVMQQFWSCIGAGAKGIGDQGEFDISQRPDTWRHWVQAVHDIADLSPLLLQADRPRSHIALLYSVESEWMQAVYRAHPLEIWRQHHTFELIQAALQRANIPYDIVSTLDLAENPTLLDGYESVICAALDYARKDVYDVLCNARAKIYMTPASALKIENAIPLSSDFDELYRLYKEVPLRDPRTYHDLINQRADYFRELFADTKIDAWTTTKDSLIYVLEAPGCKLVTPVNCALNWQFSEDPSEEAMARIRNIRGQDFEMPRGAVSAPDIAVDVAVADGKVAYDLRTRQRIAVSDVDGKLMFQRELAGGEGTIVLIAPTEIASVEIAVDERNADGCHINISALDDGGVPLTWALPVKIEVFDPEGKVTPYSTRGVLLNGHMNVCFNLAVNDAGGVWTVRVTELASGLQDVVTFEVVN